ncbi:MAG: hypothetical protein ABI134_12845, partial [Byssovorax sp.]
LAVFLRLFNPFGALAAVAAPLHLPVHAFAWSRAADDAGLQRDAAYLVRPDGYVGLAAAANDASALTQYVRKLVLSFG